MSKKTNYKVLIIDIVSGLFILLFLYTSISKLKEHMSFQIVLSKSPFLASYSILLSWVIPFVEMLVSALLFIPVTRLIGLKLSFALMLGFTGYIAYMLFTTSTLPCSCGGVLKKLSWTEHLIFNIAFLILSMIALWLIKKNNLLIAITRNSRTPA